MKGSWVYRSSDTGDLMMRLEDGTIFRLLAIDPEQPINTEPCPMLGLSDPPVRCTFRKGHPLGCSFELPNAGTVEVDPHASYPRGTLVEGVDAGGNRVVGFVTDECRHKDGSWWVDTLDPAAVPANWRLVFPTRMLRTAEDITRRLVRMPEGRRDCVPGLSDERIAVLAEGPAGGKWVGAPSTRNEERAMAVEIQAWRLQRSRSSEATPDELAPLRERIAKGRAKYANGCTILSLLDEAGEVAHAVNKYEPADRIRAELLDVAAVAMRLYAGEIDRGLEIDGLVQRRTDGEAKVQAEGIAPVAGERPIGDATGGGAGVHVAGSGGRKPVPARESGEVDPSDAESNGVVRHPQCSGQAAPERPVWCVHTPIHWTLAECQIFRRDENRYEPDRTKRCGATHREPGKETFAVCNRTAGHPDEHERWSHTGIKIDIWPAEQRTDYARNDAQWQGVFEVSTELVEAVRGARRGLRERGQLLEPTIHKLVDKLEAELGAVGKPRSETARPVGWARPEARVVSPHGPGKVTCSWSGNKITPDRKVVVLVDGPDLTTWEFFESELAPETKP